MKSLEVRGLSVHYGALEAIHEFDLDVNEGEIVFLVGPNGAGKSTFLKALANVVRATTGTIQINEKATRGMAPEDVVRLGFTMVPEGRDIFGTLTVEENLKLGAYSRSDADGIRRDFDMIVEEFHHLRNRLYGPAGLLSGGEQQMLAIGRGLMTASRFMALDEPSLGLAPKIIDQIYEILMRLRERRKLTLLVAEQNLSRAVRMGARVIVLRGGRPVLDGNARQLSAAGTLERAYFGF